MADFTSNLTTWASTGSAYPSDYSYLQGESPVDEWDNYAMYHIIEEIHRLLSQMETAYTDIDNIENGGVADNPHDNTQHINDFLLKSNYDPEGDSHTKPNPGLHLVDDGNDNYDVDIPSVVDEIINHDIRNSSNNTLLIGLGGTYVDFDKALKVRHRITFSPNSGSMSEDYWSINSSFLGSGSTSRLNIKHNGNFRFEFLQPGDLNMEGSLTENASL